MPEKKPLSKLQKIFIGTGAVILTGLAGFKAMDMIADQALADVITKQGMAVRSFEGTLNEARIVDMYARGVISREEAFDFLTGEPLAIYFNHAKKETVLQGCEELRILARVSLILEQKSDSAAERALNVNQGHEVEKGLLALGCPTI
jgi:hypothetical protein